MLIEPFIWILLKHWTTHRYIHTYYILYQINRTTARVYSRISLFLCLFCSQILYLARMNGWSHVTIHYSFDSSKRDWNFKTQIHKSILHKIHRFSTLSQCFISLQAKLLTFMFSWSKKKYRKFIPFLMRHFKVIIRFSSHLHSFSFSENDFRIVKMVPITDVPSSCLEICSRTYEMMGTE